MFYLLVKIHVIKSMYTCWFCHCYSSNNGSKPTRTPDGDVNAYSLEPNTDTSCKPIQSKWYLPTYVKMQLTRYHADCPVSSVFSCTV